MKALDITLWAPYTFTHTHSCTHLSTYEGTCTLVPTHTHAYTHAATRSDTFDEAPCCEGLAYFAPCFEHSQDAALLSFGL